MELTAGGQLSPRDRRLAADARKVLELSENSDLIEARIVDAGTGRPPEIWEVTFRCRGIVGAERDGRPVYGDYHRVRIELGREYPRQAPGLRWLTPILHPNIEGHGAQRVCIAQWHVGRTLETVVLMLGEMVQYKNYHAEMVPPYPLDNKAAKWALKAERAGYFSRSRPVDPRPLLRPDHSAGQSPTTTAPRVRVRSATTPPIPPTTPRIRISRSQP
ncbi:MULTISPECIES: ubiquitin-conjugating enzyme E2 [Frankia]|uniref:UBC core domain-containing protein n=1 Tax=Frankia alni (strain DSM 45986 / CECT 9034 / ACN14a) TaxID=326424 RepID=Q0RSE1_FRAAA|nr:MULTISPECIES: ubiquitin-conjugating enzyme E2 [Frankia]CAJ59522.1 hypothetical protein FRAAL0854 [Frankia alni ACN14a]